MEDRSTKESKPSMEQLPISNYVVYQVIMKPRPSSKYKGITLQTLSRLATLNAGLSWEQSIIIFFC